MAATPPGSSLDAAIASLGKALDQIGAICAGNVVASANATVETGTSASAVVEEPISSTATAPGDANPSSATDESTIEERKFPQDLESFHKCDIRVRFHIRRT